MNGTKLIGMAVALVILAGIAFMQKMGGQRRHRQHKMDETTLFQGLDLNTIDGIEVAKGTDSAVLSKKDGIWVNTSLHDYPADFPKLADALRKAAEVTLGAPVRAANVEASEFGMDQAKTVRLKSSGREVVKLEVGARREASESAGWANQHFVRKNGSDEIYLVDYDFRPFAETSADWIDDEILNVRSADIVSVKAGDVELKADGPDWKLSDLNEEKEEFQSSEANKLRMALQYLNCTTVADPAKTDAELGFTNRVEYIACDKAGLVYTATLGGEADGGRYVRFNVTYEPPEPPTALADDAEQEKNDAYQKEMDAFNASCETNRKQAAELDAKRSIWTYVISTGDAEDFLIGRDKLVKEKEPPLTEESGEKKEPGQHPAAQ
jgi:hypothetical protein